MFWFYSVQEERHLNREDCCKHCRITYIPGIFLRNIEPRLTCSKLDKRKWTQLKEYATPLSVQNVSVYPCKDYICHPPKIKLWLEIQEVYILFYFIKCKYISWKWEQEKHVYIFTGNRDPIMWNDSENTNELSDI